MSCIFLVSLIAIREIRERVFSPAYILFGLALPLFAGGSILSLLIDQFEERTDALQSSSELFGVIIQIGFFLSIIFASTLIVGGTTEEKIGRIIEVLLVPLRPSELLAGKVLGLGILGLAPLVLIAISGTVALVGSQHDLIDVVTIPSLGSIIFWLILGYFFFAIGYSAVGALVVRPEEVSLSIMPMAVLSVGGLVCASVATQNPQSIVTVITSYVPPAAPFVVPQRVLAGTISVWEHLFTNIVMIAAVIVMFRVGSRVYSGGLLHFNNRTKIREAYRLAELDQKG